MQVAQKESLAMKLIALLVSAAMVFSLSGFSAATLAFADDDASDEATEYTVSFVQSDGETESMMAAYVESATAVANDDASTTWTIPVSDAPEAGSTIDFYYSYTITAASRTNTHAFQFVLGDQNDDGTYAWTLYYNGSDVTSRYGSFFGDSLSVTEEEDGTYGVGITCYQVSGCSDITVSYDVTTTVTADSVATEAGYTVSLTPNSTYASMIESITVGEEAVEADEDGMYSFTLDSIESATEVAFVVNMGSTTSTSVSAYLIVTTDDDGAYSAAFYKDADGTSASMIESMGIFDSTTVTYAEASTTWTIPATDVATGSYVDFNYGYTITAMSRSMTHAFQLLIGEQNGDGTYAYEIYYSGAQNDSWDSYFGDSVTVTDEGVELTTYEVSMLSDITVSYDSTETVAGESAVNDDATYTISFAFNTQGAAVVTAVSYDGTELTADDDGVYTLTVASIDELIPVEITTSVMSSAVTAYLSVEEATDDDTDADSDGTDDGTDADSDGTDDSTGTDSDEVDTDSADYKAGYAAGFADATAVNLDEADVTLAKSSVVYTGKAKKPAVTVVYDGTTLVKGTDYEVYYFDNTAVGTATVVVAGEGAYTGSVTKTFKITKASQTLTVKKSAKTVKYAKVKKSKQTVKAITKVSGAKGKVTYTLNSAKKSGKSYKSKFTVNSKTGKVTVKKGTAKGTYKVKIKVKAAATTNYKAASKTVTVTVKVK